MVCCSGVTLIVLVQWAIIYIEWINGSILFEGQKTISIKEKNWRVIVDLNFDSIESDKTVIQEMIDKTNKTFTVMNDLGKNAGDRFSFLDKQLLQSYSITNERYQKYSIEVTKVLALMPIIRGKRGLLNLGGSVLKALFGVMDEEDRNNFERKITDLDDRSFQMISNTKQELTVLKNLNTITNNNTDNIKRIMGHIDQYEKIINSVVNKDYREMNNDLNKIENHIQITGVLSNIEGCIIEATTKLTTLRMGLDMLFLGKVTPELVPEEQMFEVIRSVANRINKAYALPYEVTRTNLFNFYNIIREHTVYEQGRLILILEIPLLDYNSVYRLEEIKVVPTFHNELNNYIVEIVEKKYIAVSDKFDKYFYMSEDDIQNCLKKGENHIICPENIIRYANSVIAADDCVWKERVNSTSRVNCKTKVLSKITKVFLIPYYKDVIFSTAVEVQITLQCVVWTKDSLEQKNHTVVINKIGKLAEVEGCKIITPDYEIEIMGDVESNFKVTLPSITKYENEVQLKYFNASTFEQIKESLEFKPYFINNTNEVEIDHLLKEFSDLQYRTTSGNKQIFSNITIMIVIIALGLTLTIIIVYLNSKVKLAVLEVALERSKLASKA